jgi:hypothetical protein
MSSQNMATKCIFILVVIALDFGWIHQSHWIGSSEYIMNSLIHWMGLMNCCHISDIQWIRSSHSTRPNGDTMNSIIPWKGLKAFPPVLSIWLQSVQFIAKKPKCSCLAQKIGFSAPNSCSLTWLVKGSTQLCTSKKECNKLDLTVAQ